ncbi:hypothetical protein Cob_v012178 [Colletotrichum orbiculare MAFF 240422]|uniref:Uncharacterized protein n=1 Tax=Colletotrichum orbiculare (strain 104-T / ATCC 96160 / CBS 514.97 / LARS 414 / MAFF 240422) TaxID=1213857 RepID=A0A484FA74_COLOR|nr:hypothetical protein Cob_v012178 [Colletotrichum orbiculare MAFF 240422]
MASKVEYTSLQRDISDEDRTSAEKSVPQTTTTTTPPQSGSSGGHQPYPGSTADRMFEFRDFKFLQVYLGCISVYLAAAIAALVWTYHGPVMPDSSEYSQNRVFRTPDALEVNQLYSGLALSALLAPAGMLVQWIMHDFRQLRLFALTAQKPVRLSDLDKIGDDSSAWTLKVLGKYSWWYAVMQAALIIIRTSFVPVGTLMLTVGVHRENKTGFGVVGVPTMSSDDPNVRRLATAMGWDGQGAFAPTLNDSDVFLSQTVYTFVGNIVSQSALVAEDSGIIGPTSTHNLTYNANTTYHGLVWYHWDAKCESAVSEISFTSSVDDSNPTYTFALPDGSNQTMPLTKSSTLRLWNVAGNRTSADIPAGGTTYFITVSPSSSLKGANFTGTSDPSLVQTPEGPWISRTKCTPDFTWTVGSCTFNGTQMMGCEEQAGANTTAFDTAALDKLETYMTAVPWWIFREELEIVGRTLDTLYPIPTAEDWGHFFGNIAQAIAAISTAGYFGTATVPVVELVPEDVYIMRTAVLWAVLGMLTVVLATSLLDIWRSKSRGLPFRTATFLAIANAVRGPWWDQELYGSCAADEVAMQKRSSSSVVFGADANNPCHLGLLPEVLPIERGKSYFGLR